MSRSHRADGARALSRTRPRPRDRISAESELAAAFQQNMGQVHVTAVDGANPFGYVAAAIDGVLGLARSAGLSIPAARGAAG